MENKAFNLQYRIIDKIVSKYAKRSEAIDAMAECLQISKDGVYRRLRGDTYLTPEELSILSIKYGISIDNMLREDFVNVMFRFNVFSHKVTSFENYLKPIYEDLIALKSISNVHVFYATSEIPLFYYCLYPELISFKLYTWAHSIWEMAYIKSNKFEFSLISNEVVEWTQEIAKLYAQLQSIEIWNVNVADNTLAQIEYHFNSGGFKNNSDAILLCDRLISWAEHCKKAAEEGSKFFITRHDHRIQGAEYTLYHNEMVHTNNTIFVNSPQVKIVFNTFANPNFMRSVDEHICNYTSEWFEKLLQKSNPISLHAEKNRDWFFKKVIHKIELVKKRIQLQIEESE